MLSTKTVLTPLLELGLNKYEAKVYLTLIGEGISTAKNISDITGIPYGKVYEIINSLAAKGFCTTLPTKPMKCQAISPKEAIAAAKQSVEKKYQKLERHVLNELEPMFTESKKFIEPKGIFWILNGRANVVKKIDELIQKARKSIKKKKQLTKENLELTSKTSENITDEEIIKKTAQILKTQPEHIIKTAKRFLKDLEEFKKQI